MIKSSAATSRAKATSSSNKRSTPGTGGKTPSASAARKNSCRCNTSNCLKLYCECFSRGVLCGSGCQCRDCSNTKAEENGKVKAARKAYLAAAGGAKRTKTPTSCSCRSHRYGSSILKRSNQHSPQSHYF